MVYPILSFISETFILIPIFVLYRTYSSWNKNQVMKLLMWLVCSYFILYVAVLPSDIMLLLGKDAPNSIFFYNWHYILAGYLKLAIYYSLLNTKYKKWLIWLLVAIITVFVLFEFKTDSLIYIFTDQFVTKTYVIINLFIIVLSLLYAYQLLQDLSVEDITQYSFFWLNSGFLIYHIGSISIYSFVGNGATEEEGKIAWVVNSILLVVLYYAITASFYYSKNLSKKT